MKKIIFYDWTSQNWIMLVSAQLWLLVTNHTRRPHVVGPRAQVRVGADPPGLPTVGGRHGRHLQRLEDWGRGRSLGWVDSAWIKQGVYSARFLHEFQSRVCMPRVWKGPNKNLWTINWMQSVPETKQVSTLSLSLFNVSKRQNLLSLWHIEDRV